MTDPQAPTLPISFEQALAELEALVDKLETGQLPLQEALANYKRGAELLQYCQEQLKDAQRQVQILDGERLKPFDPEQEPE